MRVYHSHSILTKSTAKIEIEQIYLVRLIKLFLKYKKVFGVLQNIIYLWFVVF